MVLLYVLPNLLENISLMVLLNNKSSYGAALCAAQIII